MLLFGTDEDVAEARALRAGPLEVIVRGSRVGPIRCGDVEVWHGVAFLFRDADWGTPEPIVEQMESTISESSFLLRATGRFPTYPIIGFRIEIEGTAEGCVRTFTTSPIVHGAEDHSVMLTLQSLPSMIETLRARFPQTAIAVGPSTIAARSSPLGNQPESDGLHRIALARQDPRCRGLFGAAWLLGYVAQLARAGVDAVTMMSLTGSSGVLAPAEGYALTKYPAYFALQRLRVPASARNVSVSDPSRIAALALGREGDQELLLANLTGDVIDVRLVEQRRFAPPQSSTQKHGQPSDRHPIRGAPRGVQHPAIACCSERMQSRACCDPPERRG